MVMIVKVPIKKMEVAGNIILAPDLSGIKGVELTSLISRDDTHMIVKVEGNIKSVSAPIYNSKEEAILDLSKSID